MREVRCGHEEHVGVAGNAAAEAQELRLMDRLAPYVRNSHDERWEL